MQSLSSTTTVTEYLQGDHRRLDSIMAECARSVASGDIRGAAILFESFRSGLTRHIKIEEGLLFPEFEAATGMSRSAGPTAVMRHEHEEILDKLRLLDGLLKAEAPDAAALEGVRAALVAILHQHNMKEEHILYPTSDQMIPADRHRKLVESMTRF